MQLAPRYGDVVDDVTSFLEERLEAAVAAGVSEVHVCLDPGIGFGKTPDQNLELVRGLDRICRIGRPVLVGLSRKSTLARVLGDPNGRVGSTSASVGAAVAAFDRGAACSASTTWPSTSRRSRQPPPWSGGASDDDRAAGHRPARVPRRPGGGTPGGQRFLVDVELDLAHEEAAVSDRIEDAVDYRQVVARVREISDARAYRLLEAFAAEIANALAAELPSQQCACGCASRTSSSTRRWSTPPSGPSGGPSACRGRSHARENHGKRADRHDGDETHW